MTGCLIEVPLDATDTTVSSAIGDGVEKHICAVDGSVHAAHALIAHGCLDSGARSRVDQSH